MPIIQMNLMQGRSEEMKRDAIVAVTDALVRTLGVRRDQVRIMINELLPENYGMGGETAKQLLQAATAQALTTEGN